MDNHLILAIERQLVALKLQIDVTLSLVQQLFKDDTEVEKKEEKVPELPKVFGGEKRVKHISIAEEE